MKKKMVEVNFKKKIRNVDRAPCCLLGHYESFEKAIIAVDKVIKVLSTDSVLQFEQKIFDPDRLNLLYTSGDSTWEFMIRIVN